MAVQRSDILPEGMTPARTSSLPTGSKQAPSRPTNTTFVTPPRSPVNKKEEPFPDFKDPSKSLIMERTLLLETLSSRLTTVPSPVRAHAWSTLEALLSRVADSGHIKHDQDVSRTGSIIPEVLAFGESIRAQRRLSNKGKLPGESRLKTNFHPSSTEAQPRHVLKEQMRQRHKRGVRQAFAYEEEFGMGFLDQPFDASEQERGRTRKRTHPGAFDRAKVITALTTLRQTYPGRYQASPFEQSRTSETSEKKQPSKKLTAEKASQQEPSQPAVFSANDTRETPGSCRCPDSFASVKKKASSVLRGLVCKVGFGRSSKEKGALSSLSPLNSHNPEPDTANGCPVDLDSFPVVLKMDDRDRSHSELSESIGSVSTSSEGGNSAPKEFAIEAGIVLPKENDVSTEPAHANAPTSTKAVSSKRCFLKRRSSRRVAGKRAARATATTRLFRPVSPPRVVQVKVRNRLQKHARPPKSAMPKEGKVQDLPKVTGLNSD